MTFFNQTFSPNNNISVIRTLNPFSLTANVANQSIIIENFGNYNRFIAASDFIASGQEGVDYRENITAQNSWCITTKQALSIQSNARENPV